MANKGYFPPSWSAYLLLTGAGAGFGLLAHAPRLSEAVAMAIMAISRTMIILGSPPSMLLAIPNLTQTGRGTTKILRKIHVRHFLRFRGPMISTCIPWVASSWSAIISALRMRTQPWLAGEPMRSSWFVPWM